MGLDQETQETRIDKNIILFFLLTIVLGASVFAYKFINYEPCQIVNFKTVAKNYRAGEIIRFKDYSKNVKKREWDFGDSTKVGIESTPFHVYKKPGNYSVRLLINGKCDSEQLLTIKEKAFVLDSTKLARFEAPEFIKVGELLKVVDKTPNAIEWEWRFGETANVNSTLQNPTYTYKTPGVKTITLVTNGDPRHASRFKIRVLKGASKVSLLPPIKKKTNTKEDDDSIIPYHPPSDDIIGIADAPPTPLEEEVIETPEENNTSAISKADFEKLLIAVSKETATASNFENYLCGNLSISAIVKNKKMNFKELCKKISGKKISIKSLSLYKNKNNGCIEYIKLDYKKGGLFK